MSSTKFLIKEKEVMLGHLQKEKRQVVDKIANWLVDNINSETDFSYIKGDLRTLIDQIIYSYWSKHYNNENNQEGWIKWSNLAGNDWEEKLSKTQDIGDVKFIKKVLMNLITSFNARETKKFREIETKIKELEQETQKGTVNEEKMAQLIKELRPFSTSISNKEHGDFPVVSSVFFARIGSAIKTAEWKLNNKNTQTDFDKKISETSVREKEKRQKEVSEIWEKVKDKTKFDDLIWEYEVLEEVERRSRGEILDRESKQRVRSFKEKILNSSSQNKQNYLAKVTEKLNNIFSNSVLKKEDLSKEIQQELEDLSSENNSQTIIEKEEKLTEKINIEVAKKKLDELVEKAKTLVREKRVAWTKKVREIENQVIRFVGESFYNQSVFSHRESELRDIFASVQNNQEQTPFWEKAVLPVLFLAGISIVIFLVARKRKFAKNK